MDLARQVSSPNRTERPRSARRTARHTILRQTPKDRSHAKIANGFMEDSPIASTSQEIAFGSPRLAANQGWAASMTSPVSNSPIAAPGQSPSRFHPSPSQMTSPLMDSNRLVDDFSQASLLHNSAASRMVQPIQEERSQMNTPPLAELASPKWDNDSRFDRLPPKSAGPYINSSFLQSNQSPSPKRTGSLPLPQSSPNQPGMSSSKLAKFFGSSPLEVDQERLRNLN